LDSHDLTVLDINRAPVANAITATPSVTEGKAFTYSFPTTAHYAAADTETITVTLQTTDKQSLSASTLLPIKLVNVSPRSSGRQTTTRLLPGREPTASQA